MKKMLILIAAALLCASQAKALIVSVDGYGEIEDSLSLTIEEGEINPLTGLYEMEVKGHVLAASTSLNVTIRRSATELQDEFCCGGNCTAGNGQTEEVRQFSVSGLSTWFTHYSPAPNSDVTVSYTFDDGEQTLVLNVRYVRAAEGIDEVSADEKAAVYTIGGTQVESAARLSEMPQGLYIHGNKKYLKTK